MEPKNKEDQQPGKGSNRSDQEGENTPPRSGNLFFFLLAIVGLLGIYMVFAYRAPQDIKQSFFEKQIQGKQYDGSPIVDEDGNPIECNIKNITFSEHGAEGEFKVAPLKPLTSEQLKALKESSQKHPVYKKKFRVLLDTTGESNDRDKFREVFRKNGVEYGAKSPSQASTYMFMFLLLIPIALFIFFWYSSRKAQDQMLGGGGFLSSFSRSPAQRINNQDEPITFDDVAGLEGVKADLEEIVDYLKEPDKFQKLGGRVPKGVLLNGPPGTGKTLLARAVAGEADVPFYSVNGSEFIQMFVGVGASRVRDLFKQAKETSPAIIFIDEIDAVGRQRGAGLGGGHDEREQTLNQILGEMDGFSQTDSVIVVAATNRPDVLDPALLRPGRFDRHISVNRPTRPGRLEIFKVHVRDVPLAADVDLESIAAGCIGMTGADIRNVVNEAALWAARNDKSVVDKTDFNYAMDKVRMGSKREDILSNEDKEKTAYHEAGHTITGWFLEGADPVHKVSVIPRGQALGLTMSIPEEDRFSYTEEELKDRLVVFMGGRAAEMIVYDELSVGAQNDLERATNIARRMITDWGMSQRLGPVSFKMADDDPFLGREIQQSRNFSEHTMEIIDEEVAKILQQSMKTAIEMLTEYRGKLDELTEALMHREELDADEIEEVLGLPIHKQKKPWKSAFESVNQKVKEAKSKADAESESDKEDAGKADTDKTENDNAGADSSDSDSNDSDSSKTDSAVRDSDSKGDDKDDSKK